MMFVLTKSLVFKIETNIPNFDFSQIKHHQSYFKNRFYFTIILTVMLLVEKPCFYDDVGHTSMQF
jgi:hypothetical protein